VQRLQVARLSAEKFDLKFKLKKTEAQYGTANNQDLLDASIDSATAQSALVSAQRDAQLAILQLRNAMGYQEIRMRNLLKWLSRGATVAALVLLLTAVGCTRGQKPGDPPAAPASPLKGPGMAEITVQAVPVEIGALVLEHQTSGTMKPVMQSQVVGQVSGVVARVARKAGDWVDKDDTVI